MAPDLSGIRRDHKARYEWVARNLPRGSRVFDLACGVGYGAYILGQAGHRVLAVDNDHEAIAYALEHYSHKKVRYLVRDATTFRPLRDATTSRPLVDAFDAVTCFETIEHIEDPRPMLRMFAKRAATLFASVPNEEKFPFKNYTFHHRHYTRAEFEQLLVECGWEVTEWWGQEGPESEVRRRINGRTAIVVAQRAKKTRTGRGSNRSIVDVVVGAVGDRMASGSFDAPLQARYVSKPISPEMKRADVSGIFEGAPVDPAIVQIDYAPKPDVVPERVAIIGLGSTVHQWLHVTRCLGNTAKLADEVWGINALGDILRCDRIFHMDDVRIQHIRAEADPNSNIAAMLEWMRKPRGIPIYTSRPHPDYPDLVGYPLAPVLNAVGGHRYFNGTAAYAIAYAIYIGVKEIQCWGVDFTFENAHRAEKGRACVEFWLGVAAAKGIKLAMPGQTPLMDGCVPDNERLYGYDTLSLSISGAEGDEVVSFAEREQLPTAQEVEHRYDHNRHPNALVEAEMEASKC